MKKLPNSGVLAALCLALLLTACDQSAIAQSDAEQLEGSKIVLDTELKEASYLLGYRQIEGLMEQTAGVVETAAFLQGVSDFVGQADSQVSSTDQGRLMKALQEAVSAKQAEASASIVSDGEAYRAEYAAKEGVTTLPSGLMYEIMTAGDGPKPKAEDTVSTHYHGMLTDGTVFDSSVDRGTPAEFPVNGVISGWTEALQLMGTGSKWRLVIPPELAYGERGAGAQIKPGATLVFEVELLEIK